MAKSFHNIVADGVFEVEHKGEKVELALAEWITNLKGKLMDEQALLDQLKKDGILHGVLHNGIQKAIIDQRAVARPAVKAYSSQEAFQTAKAALDNPNNYHINDKPGKEEITKSIVADITAAQDRIEAHKPKPVDPPSEGKNQTAKKANWAALEGSIKPLIDQLNYTSEQCVKILGNSFSPSLIKEVYNHLTK